MYVLAANHKLYKVFVFWIDSVIKLINFMKKVEIFPHVSLWDTTIALAIINVIMWIVKYGISRYHILSDDMEWVRERRQEVYQPKHVYQGKHSPGNASYKPRHAKRR